MRKINLAIIICLFYSTSTISVENQYYTDPQKLSDNERELYLNIQSTINDWTGKADTLETANQMIRSFTKINPFFLPIYIEKSRYTIMTGYIGSNDSITFNKKALEILIDIQKKDSVYSQSYVLAGHVYTNLKDYGNARKSLTKALELGSNDPWLYNNWATLLLEQKHYEEALYNSIKAVQTAEGNSKALIVAILNLQDISAKLGSTQKEIDVVSILFRSIKDPLRRIRIAQRLVSAYSGRRQVLDYAYQIILKQKQETPDLIQCDIEMANLILKSGLLYTKNNIVRYNEKSIAAAKKLLIPLNENGKEKDRVFGLLMDIALSENNYKQAQAYINNAPIKGISDKIIKTQQAILDYSLGNYQSTIDIFNGLAKSDISFKDNIYVISAYKNLGGVDKLNEYYLSKVTSNPNSAWANGNYAVFLLFEKHDAASAIQYGEKALDLMDYPMARNVTGLAYLIKAVEKLSDKKKDESFSFYERSRELGVTDDYVSGDCMTFCSEIEKLKSTFAQRVNKEI